MQFIDQKEIYEKTDGGRLVIEAYYPNSTESFVNPHRKFKARGNEKTPSCSLKYMPEEGVWLVTDFGNDQQPRNCIQVAMLEENCDFKTAINIIANRFNIIPEDKKSEVYKAIISTTDAEPDQQDGEWIFEPKEFSLAEIQAIIAPKIWDYLIKLSPKKDDVKPEEVVLKEVSRVFLRYGFHALKSYTIIKNRKATKIESSDFFPIYMFDQKDWKKIYKPKELEAGRRFIHYKGRPSEFIFGLHQASNAYKEVIKINEDEDEMDVEDSPKPKSKKEKKKKLEKLKHIFLVSGGSDGLNLALIGQAFKGEDPEKMQAQYWPVWMNSETAKLTSYQFKELERMAEKVYNIPDIDATGKREAHKMASEHLDIHTLYLPEELKEKKDGIRNKPCKDLRDYFRFYTPWEFTSLLKTAYPYRFWDRKANFDKSGTFLGMRYEVNNKCMLNFLARNGFYRFETESEKDLYLYVHIANNVVKQIEPKRIRDYINEFIEKREPEMELMNLFLRTTQLNESSLSNLPFVQIDFNDFDKQTQWMFFKNRTFKVTAEAIEEFKPGEIEKFTWEQEVITHKVTKMKDIFTITQPQHEGEQWDIEINDPNCIVLNYLINGSRLYWREELENRLEGIPETEQDEYAAKFELRKDDLKLLGGLPKTEWDKYRQQHKFSIAGPLLTPTEQLEQKQHLINKIFAIGYNFHRHKENSKTWATWTMDAKLSEGDESHGGSGKSLLQMLIYEHKLMQTQYLEGRNAKLTDNPHVYEGITKHTDLVIVDDSFRYLKFDFFFPAITGPLKVNPKNSKHYTVAFSDSPKFWFSSNYPPHNIDQSKERRILYTIFSDYYHYNKMDEYREERKVFDDFGKNLGADFTEQEWDSFLNFIMQCIRFYLSVVVKINPPMEKVNKRNLKATMGDAFEPWADVYFSEESGRLDSLQVKDDALHDFLNTTMQKWTTQKFTSALKAWCQYNGYQLDPKEFQNSQGRIIRKVKVKDKLGLEKEMTKEHVYIRTQIAQAMNIANELIDKDLPF